MELVKNKLSKRTYKKWGGAYFVLLFIVVLIHLSLLYGFFNTAQGSKDEIPQNAFYEGKVDRVNIYTFETSTNQSCVLARRSYDYPVSISCTKKE